MAKKKPPKSPRRPTRLAPAKEVAPDAPPDGAPTVRADLVMITWQLQPKRVAALRRRLISGTAGEIERTFLDIYSEVQDAATTTGYMRYMTLEQCLAGEGNKPGPQFLNAPPGHPKDPPPMQTYGLTWGLINAEIVRTITRLIDDPKYHAALKRRIENGSAAGMDRYFWRLASRKPADLGLRKRRPLCFICKTLPWLADPLAEQERKMIEAQEAEERRQQDKPVTPLPDDPDDPNGLELVRDI